MRGEGMAQGMTGYTFLNPGLLRGIANRLLQTGLVDMMPASDAGTVIHGQPRRQEDILPGPAAGGLAQLARQ